MTECYVWFFLPHGFVSMLACQQSYSWYPIYYVFINRYSTSDQIPVLSSVLAAT